MKNKVLAVVSVTLGFFMVSDALFAHHSDSVFDQDRLITIIGTVTRYRFANPHTRIYMDVKDDKGNVEPWIITGGALGSMSKVGWTHRTIKPGEELTISGFQYWDGRKVMIHVKLTRANGEEIPTSESEVRRLARFLEKFGARTVEDLSPNIHLRVGS